jgi:hypothetical protein
MDGIGRNAMQMQVEREKAGGERGAEGERSEEDS